MTNEERDLTPKKYGPGRRIEKDACLRAPTRLSSFNTSWVPAGFRMSWQTAYKANVKKLCPINSQPIGTKGAENKIKPTPTREKKRGWYLCSVLCMVSNNKSGAITCRFSSSYFWAQRKIRRRRSKHLTGWEKNEPHIQISPSAILPVDTYWTFVFRCT